MKGLSIRKTEAAYPRLMYYTAAFVLKQLCHSEGVLCSLSGKLDSSMTGFILRDYSVFTLSANGRLCLTTCPFLLGDLANSETLAFISSKCLNFVYTDGLIQSKTLKRENSSPFRKFCLLQSDGDMALNAAGLLKGTAPIFV